MSEFIYEGTEVLENLTEAINYNNSLKNLVIREAKGKNVLDFGAGIGTFSDLLKDNLDPVCLEIDQDQAKLLNQKGFQVVQDLKEESWDYIYSLNVLEHIEDHQEISHKLIKALKPGGKLLIFVPAFNLLFSDLDKKVGHFRRYKKEDLKALFNKPEVKIQKINYFDTIGFFFALVFRLLNLKTDQINIRNVIIFDRLFFPLNKLLDPLFSKVLGKNVYVVVEKLK